MRGDQILKNFSVLNISMEQPKLSKDLFQIKMHCGIDYKFMADWCIKNEHHPLFTHLEDGIHVPNQFSDNLRAYVRGATEGSNYDEHSMKDGENSEKIEDYRTYNPFTFGIPCFANLYWILNQFFYSNPQVMEAGEPYYIHGWFNVYTKKDEDEKGYDHIPWHKHLNQYHPHVYHGFYCANVQPSETWYRIGPDQPEEDIVKHTDYNDMIIYSPSSFEHTSTPWLEDKPRITVAFDILPESVYFGGFEEYQWGLDPRQYQAIPFPYCL